MNSNVSQLSEHRLTANRANAAKSTGPRTAEGKAKSSQNAIRHGLCATTFVVNNEDQDDLQHMRDHYDARFGPRDLAESDLVDRMVRATWKLRRASNMENELLNVQMLRMEAELNRTFTDFPERTRLTAAFSELAKEPALALLHRYANNLSAEYQRAFKALRELQKDVPIAPPGAPSETNPTAVSSIGAETAPESASETSPTSHVSKGPETAPECVVETIPTVDTDTAEGKEPESASETNPSADAPTGREAATESVRETNPRIDASTGPETSPECLSETNPAPPQAAPLLESAYQPRCETKPTAAPSPRPAPRFPTARAHEVHSRHDPEKGPNDNASNLLRTRRSHPRARRYNERTGLSSVVCLNPIERSVVRPDRAMFDNLSEKLQRVFKNLRGEGKLSAENMEAALREIRVALLEADVHFRVVKQLIEGIKEKAMGQEVLTALSPTQQVVKIVHDELVKILGSHTARLRFANEPPTTFMIVGLQGSGKTTSTGKLAKYLAKESHRPLLVSVDVYRPAARHQLSVIARDIKHPVYEGTPEETKPVDLARSARREAAHTGRDILLVDTAGRLHIDDQLMTELQELKELLNPTEILFVADAMTGQDAVKSADEFHKRLGITGVILTKMDGDARGGAALSIRTVTQQPLKFIGTGEKFDALEPFHPDRVANRILGMGDVLSLIEKVEQNIDQRKAEEMQRKIIENEFTLEDFRDQIKQLRKLGPLESLLGMMPQLGPLKDLKNVKVDENEITRIVAIIDSMTRQERNNHMIINGARRRRIAKGSGTSVQEVNSLLKQYSQARKMMKSLSTGSFLGKRLGKMKLPPMFGGLGAD